MNIFTHIFEGTKNSGFHKLGLFFIHVLWVPGLWGSQMIYNVFNILWSHQYCPFGKDRGAGDWNTIGIIIYILLRGTIIIYILFVKGDYHHLSPLSPLHLPSIIIYPLLIKRPMRIWDIYDIYIYIQLITMNHYESLLMIPIVPNIGVRIFLCRSSVQKTPSPQYLSQRSTQQTQKGNLLMLKNPP